MDLIPKWLKNFKLDSLIHSRVVQIVLAVIVGLIGTILFIRIYIKSRRKAAKKSYARDVVVLHQFPYPKAKKPSLSPFCLKTEAWLRVNQIKYQNEFSMLDRSTKGKLPYITLNEVEVADSSFAIDYLASTLSKDLDKEKLTDSQKAVSRAFSLMLEESFRWFKMSSTSCEKNEPSQDLAAREPIDLRNRGRFDAL